MASLLAINAPTDPQPDESRLFADEKGFFRARPAGLSGDPRFDGWAVPDGPLAAEQADVVVRDFLDRLADGRETAEHPDPIDYARENGLMVLFGPREQGRFEQLYDHLPDDRVAAWRELLSGGRSSEAFGPLTLEEQLDEAAVEEALAAGAKRHRRNLLVGGVIAALVIGFGAFAWSQRGDDERTAGGIRFGDPAAVDETDRSGGPPVAEPALTARLDTAIVVREGTGDVGERIVDPVPDGVLPVSPGTLSFSLFEFAGSAHVVLVGPPGWTDAACVVASVASGELRAFDTVWVEGSSGACGGRQIGHEGSVSCRSDSVVMVGLEIPTGPVELSEGGTGFADTVRAQVLNPAEGYETASVRGAVVVSDDAGAVIPRFGGAVDETVDFELIDESGGTATGTCDLV